MLAPHGRKNSGAIDCECLVSQVRNINPAVILSEVWSYFGQTDSKDLRFGTLVYDTIF